MTQTVKINVFDEKTKKYEEVEFPANSDIAKFIPVYKDAEVTISRGRDGQYTARETANTPLGEKRASSTFSEQGEMIKYGVPQKNYKATTVKVRVFDDKTEKYEEVEFSANSDIVNFNPSYKGNAELSVSRRRDGKYEVWVTVDTPIGKKHTYDRFSEQGVLVYAIAEMGIHNSSEDAKRTQKNVSLKSAQRRLAAENDKVQKATAKDKIQLQKRIVVKGRSQ